MSASPGSTAAPVTIASRSHQADAEARAGRSPCGEGWPAHQLGQHGQLAAGDLDPRLLGARRAARRRSARAPRGRPPRRRCSRAPRSGRPRRRSRRSRSCAMQSMPIVSKRPSCSATITFVPTPSVESARPAAARRAAGRWRSGPRRAPPRRPPGLDPGEHLDERGHPLDPFIHMDQMGEVEYAPGRAQGHRRGTRTAASRPSPT